MIDLLEWYFLLAYSIGGVLLVLGVTVLVVVCWLHHDQCCDKVAEKKATRLRVRRSKVALGKPRVFIVFVIFFSTIGDIKVEL